MARISGLVFIVILCCGWKLAVASEDVGSTTCDHIYNLTTGTVEYNNNSDTVPSGVINCTWTIKFLNSTNVTHQEVFLVMERFHLFDKDTLEIFDNTGSEKKPLNVGIFSGQRGAFSVLTGVSNIIVQLDTSTNNFSRRFLMTYYTTPGCGHKFSSLTTGTFQSPVYDVKRNYSINCNFFLAPREKSSFKLATIITPLQPPVANLSLKVAGSELKDDTYQGLNSSVEFISENILHLNISIQPDGKSLQQVDIAFEVVTKECSGTNRLEKGNTFTFTNPANTEASVSETPSLNCRRIVFTNDSGVAALTVRVDAHTLPGSLDQLQVLNGIGSQAASILHLTSNNVKEWEDQYYMTNRQNLSISLLSSFPSPKMNVSITVGTADNGGYFEDNGTIGLTSQKSEPAIFLLKVDPKKQVKLDLVKNIKEGNLKFFSNFEKNGTPFAELASMRTATAFISPSPLMMVQASNFGTEVFTATFGSVERGCFSTGTDETGTYNLFGKCVSLCAWTIPGKVNATNKEMRKLHFSSLFLNAGDDLLIVQMNNTPLANVTGLLLSMPDFDIPAKEGVNVIVRRNCSRNDTSLTAVVADYAPVAECGHNLTLETGKSFILSSPGYPNSYPVKSNCLWNIGVKKSDLLHVTFQSLRLGGTDHQLKLTKRVSAAEDAPVADFVGPTLPNDTLPQDYVVSSANLTVTFGGGVYNRSIEGSVYGFQMNITAVDCGGVMDKSGAFSTPPGKGNTTTDAKLCFWLISVNNTKIKNIILYSSNSSTSPNGYLEIHEGASIRDQLSTNLTGTNLTSRLDRMLFVYRNPNTTAGPLVSVSFASIPCNLTQMCGNGVCMHADWVCDGKNDCGDWSDERYCNSTCPSPSPPTPSPPQPPSPAGVSGGTLAGGILGALLIGALLGFLLPILARWYRSRPSTEYSTLIGASG